MSRARRYDVPPEGDDRNGCARIAQLEGKGFLKNGPVPIEIVDAANTLKLSTHVGERVSVTGLLVDREMTLRSLQRVAASCG